MVTDARNRPEIIPAGTVFGLPLFQRRARDSSGRLAVMMAAPTIVRRLFNALMPLALLLICLAGPAQADIVPVDAGKDRVTLDQHVDIMRDATRQLTIDQVLAGEFEAEFQANDTLRPNFSYSSDAFWIRFSLRNSSDDRLELIVNLEEAVLDRIDAYVVRNGGAIQHMLAGDKVPVSKRTVQSRTPVFPVEIEPGGSVMVYIRVVSVSNISLPLSVWDEDAFFDAQTESQMLFGAYYGMMLVMVLYNLFVYVTVRDRNYLLYVCYIGLIVLFQFAQNGFANLYLWRESPGWTDPVIILTGGGANFFLLLFTPSFLQTHIYTPRLHRFFRVLSVAIFVLTIYGMYDYYSGVGILSLVGSLSGVTILVAGIICLRKGFLPARFFLVAWVSLIVGQWLHIAGKLGVFPASPVTRYSLQIGTVVEVVLLSLALADRINVLRREKNHAQLSLLRAEREALEAQQEMTRSFARFVPREFLETLGRESIEQIKLGDHTKARMTILFADIRNFTTLSETMTPEENFRFINGYLGMVTPMIARHRGFIDKYIGDEVMALFPEDPADALRSAVGMIEQIRIYNGYRANSGYQPISIGVGMHVGEMMLGTVGVEERLEGTVISDSVNTAARVERLTRLFGADIIATSSVLDDVAGNAFDDIRFLGRVELKGKQERVDIFDVFHGDVPEVAERKRQTRDRFEDAVRAYLDQDFAASLVEFRFVLKTDPSDTAAQYYLSLCEARTGLDGG